MKVLIVGGGIGGLTLAAFLGESGIDYEVIEKNSDWSSKGFLIGIWDNGRDIMRKLGLAEQFDKAGTIVRNVSVRDEYGNTIKNYSLSRLYTEFGGAATVVKRSDLHALLSMKIPQSKIRMGTSLESLTQTEHEVAVSLSSGAMASYDVVVGADGVHSTVRNILFKKQVEVYEDWRVWYLWIENDFGLPATIVEYVAPAEFAAIFTGAGKSMIWMASPAQHKTFDRAEDRVARLKRIFKSEVARMPGFLDRMDAADIMLSDLVHFNLKKWFEDRVVLLGDAAHNFGPYAGIGGSMAMEDAYVLAGELMQVSKIYPLNEALQNYQSKRRHRIHMAELINREIRLASLIRSPFLRRGMNYILARTSENFLIKPFARLFAEEI